jgi:DDE family transposase
MIRATAPCGRVPNEGMFLGKHFKGACLRYLTFGRADPPLSYHWASPHVSYFERVRGYHQTKAYQKAMNKRKVWVEPLFAEAKDWHGMRRFRLRLLWRVNIEALRTAAGQNLKRLLKKRGWGRRPFPVEALCAFFLAALGRSARPDLEYWSFFVTMSSAYSMILKQ